MEKNERKKHKISKAGTPEAFFPVGNVHTQTPCPALSHQRKKPSPVVAIYERNEAGALIGST
jgi:hypothetical protein